MIKNLFKMELHTSNTNEFESEIPDFYIDESDLDQFDTNDNKTVLD